MSELTIYLDKTNSAQFCVWLSSYSEKMRRANAEYPYMGGAVYRIGYPLDVYQVRKVSFSAQIMRPADPNQQAPLDMIQAWNISDPDEGVTYSYWAWDTDDVLNLSWLEVGERLKITIKHEGVKWIIPPAFTLLWNIKADFPETGDTILSYIKEKADWWNLNPPYTLGSNAAVAYIIAEQARDEINKKVNEITEQEPQAVGAAKSEIRCPKKGSKKYNDWKAAWRKVKGRWKGGDSYKSLAQFAQVSPETMADIVKAGDAGLLE